MSKVLEISSVLVVLVGWVAAADAAVVRDDFDVSFDYSTGAVPAGGIWSGSYNAGNGGATFDANTTLAGSLTMGSDEVGWEGGGRDDARFLYRSVPADEFREARLKITGQTRGPWHQAGFLIRQPTPLDNVINNDNLITAGVIDTETTLFGGFGTATITQNIQNGVEIQEQVTNEGQTSADVAYLRLVHHGVGAFELFSSSDGASWVSRWAIANNALAAGNIEVGLWAGTYVNLIVNEVDLEAVASFDYFEIETGADAPEPLAAWNVDGSGDWNRGNWDVVGGKPDSNTSVAVFGPALTAASAIVYTNQTVKVKTLQFDNANQYILAGAGMIDLDSDAGNATIDVVQGAHEIQVALKLSDNTTATAQAGATLAINAPIYLNGKTFTTSGTVNLNHGTIFGSGGGGGALVNDGDLSGLGSVGGDFEQTGGGSLSFLVGESPVEVAGTATLAGALEVALADGFTPQIGALYTVLTAESVTDAGLALTGAGASMFQLVVGADSVSLLATAAPEPGMLAIVAGGLAMCAGVRRRRTAIFGAKAVALVAALVLGWSSAAVAQYGTFRDDFGNDANPNGAMFDFTTGNVPAGSIWSGIHNPTNGGVPESPGFFVSDGFDFDGNSKAGKLFIEDLGAHLNEDGSTVGIGWEGGRNNAPFLYRTIPADANFTATMKIDAQTAGNWSYLPIIARLAGNTVGHGIGGALDPTESFVTLGSFKPNDAAPDDGFILSQSIVNAVETETGGPGFTTPMPMWLRVEKIASQFTSFISFDGTTFTQQNQINNTALNTAGTSLEVGMAYQRFIGAYGTAEIDYFEIEVEAPGTLFNSDWAPLASGGGSGNWSNPDNWSANVAGTIPNTNTVNVRLGGGINAPSTVILNEAATVRSLTFESAHKYAVSGTGSITFQPDPINNPGTPDIVVNQGKHDVQVAVALGTSNTDLTAAAGTEINFNNTLNLGGRQLIVSGPGRVNVNHNVDTGTAGSLVSTGNVGGSGRVNGNLQNNGGVVNPGNGVGTLTVDALFSQNATGILNIELGGTGNGQYDRLVVGTSAVLNGFVSASYVNGFVPAIGDTFTILTATTVNNAGVIELAPQDVPYYQLIVNANNVQLRVLALEPTGGLIGDYNSDGKVDAADYTVWRDKLGSSAVLPNRDPANSGNVSAADYNSWKSHFGQMAGAGSLDVAAVPEPASALMLASVVLMAVAARRGPRDVI